MSRSCSASDSSGRGELDQLDFLKLVLANDAARVFAGGSGLGAKAGRVGREADGQARFVEDFVAIEIGDRNLGGGDEPVVVVFEFAAADRLRVGIGAAEKVFGKLGQLAGSEQALAVDHEGRQHFGVAVLLRVQVEHEADEGPFEPRARAHVDGEARAGELGGAFQVENAERFAEFPVRLGFEVEAGFRAPGFYGDVVGFGRAGGDFVAGEVGNAGEGRGASARRVRKRSYQVRRAGP